MASTRVGKRRRAFGLQRRAHAHADVIFAVGRGRDRVDARRVGERFDLGRQRRRGHLRHHVARLQAAAGVRNAGSPLSAGLTSRSERRSLIVASCASAIASMSAASATGAPWKLPPDTISPSSANTMGLSVAALASVSSVVRANAKRLARRAVYLRRTPQRVGVLDPPQCSCDLLMRAAFEQPADVAAEPTGRDAAARRGCGHRRGGPSRCSASIDSAAAMSAARASRSAPSTASARDGASTAACR